MIAAVHWRWPTLDEWGVIVLMLLIAFSVLFATLSIFFKKSR